ncbi:hypothetical protein [Fodinicola acaciae]|uniref:hypothetical protein n=1 Tax=Fodinicola acaciae TaxID=2681555 RepID=UPI0013D43C08|nr:hypothetical protein [Fodinicola acaciae]
MSSSRTTATVLAAVAVWRRASANARPRRYVELRVAVEDPRDPAAPELPAELTVADDRTYRHGQRIEVVIDLRTGAVALAPVERSKARPDVRFTVIVLVGVAAAVVVIGALAYFLSVTQSRVPQPTPSVSAPAATPS